MTTTENLGVPSRPRPTGARVPDLVVLSHLRWDWVWQRPQHLVSRFAARRREAGSNTWFVEEPVPSAVERPELRWEEADGLTRVTLHIPASPGLSATPGFDSDGAQAYQDLLLPLLMEQGMQPGPDVLVYTPMAVDIARSLTPARLIYDVMDDLASFRNASPGLRLSQRRLLAAADVLFAGGRSLHQGISALAEKECHLFPSGVDVAHYEPSSALRSHRDPGLPKVAGYVGVIDERLDLELIGALARALPDWTIRIVGPIAKIDPDELPAAPNLEYPGMAAYGELPAVMAGFDVALMPFALNEATRSISPTKTLEYLAAGLPVVSTRVPDVVADYATTVALEDDAEGFARACLRAAEQPVTRSTEVDGVLSAQSWDGIASAMDALVAATPERVPAPPWPAPDLESAHRKGTWAAAAGLRDAALGEARLMGPDVAVLAEAAVSSATPFLRAPLLARISAVLALHPAAGDAEGNCPTCSVTAPCPTAQEVSW